MELGEAQLDLHRRTRRLWRAGRLDLLQAVQHGGHDRRVVADLAVGGPGHRQLQLLRLHHRRGLRVGQSPAEDLGEMVVLLESIGTDLVGGLFLTGGGDVEGVLGPGEADVKLSNGFC